MRFEKLGNIAEVIAGQSPKSETYNQNGDGLPFFQGKTDFGEMYPKARYWCNEPTKIALPNDILISVRAPVGPVNICDVESCIGRGLGAIRVNENISKDYVYYFLKANEKRISNLGVGSTFKAITQREIRNIVVPLPALEDQIHIATLLSKAEALIKQRKESIDLLDDYLKSTFLEMFGAGDKSNFPIKTLNEVSIKITDGEHGTVERLDQGRLYLMARNITRSNELDFEQVSYISENAHQKIYKRCNPQKDDLLMVCVGATIGKVALVPEMEEFSIARSVALIKPNHKLIDSRYLLWFFNTDFGIRQIKSGSNEAAQAGLYTGNLKKIKIPLPPIEIQHQFTSIVKKVELINFQYQSSLAELENLYDSLSQKAFKGELNLVKGEEMLMAAEPKVEYGKRQLI